MNTAVGTRYCQAPELFLPKNTEKGNYDYKADLWSLGVLIYYLCTQKLPFDDPNSEILKDKIINVYYDTDIDVSPDFKELISKLLKKDPK